MWTINWKAVSPSKPTFSDLVSQVRPHIWKIQQSFKIMALLGTNCSKMWALGEITAPNHSYKWFFRSYVICTHMCMYTFYNLYMHTIHVLCIYRDIHYVCKCVCVCVCLCILISVTSLYYNFYHINYSIEYVIIWWICTEIKIGSYH